MPVKPEMVSWPITGGLDSKKTPLAQEPGTYIQLDDVRMERSGEWRTRSGFPETSTDRIDNFGIPFRAGVFGNGGAWCFASDDSLVTSGGKSGLRHYTPLSISGTKWRRADTNAQQVSECQQVQPTSWDRIPTIAAVPGLTAVSHAVGGGFVMTAWGRTDVTFGSLLVVQIRSATTGDVVSSQVVSLALASARVCCTYTNGYLLAFSPYVTAGQIRVESFNTATGVYLGSQSFGVTDAHATDPYIDAITYGSSLKATLVIRRAGDAIRFIEYNPVTNVADVNVASIAAGCTGALVLLPNPEDQLTTGTRLVAYSTSVPTVRVARITSAGAVTADEIANSTAGGAGQIAGVAYTAGTEWMIVHQAIGGNVLLYVSRKRSGTITTSAGFWNGGGGGGYIRLRSGGWRSSSGDRMHVMFSVSSTNASDPQDTYFEKVIPYDLVTLADANAEHASRLLPLQAGPAPTIQSNLPQTIMTSAVGTFPTTFSLVLTRTSRFTRTAAAVVKETSIDRWTQTFLYPTAVVNQGRPVSLANKSYMPSGSLLVVGQGITTTHGIGVIRYAPTFAVSIGGAAALTLLATYQYLTVVRCVDENGDVWRSPPSLPATITLTGSFNNVTVTSRTSWAGLENDSRSQLFSSCYVDFYRTKANGSVFQMCGSSEVPTVIEGMETKTFLDAVSDANLNSAEFLYSHGEVATAITPAAAHVAVWGDRLWLADRDFRTQLWFSKNLRPKIQAEFANEFILDLDDEYGAITGMEPLDDKLIVFKANATYVIQGEGPSLAGTGAFPTVTRLETDLGCVLGAPTVSTGSEVFFVATRGIYRVTTGLEFDFVGAPIAGLLTEAVYTATFLPAMNEVRFSTPTYVFSYDRYHGLWARWTGMSGMHISLSVAGQHWYGDSSGYFYRENSATAADGSGANITAKIRSAWIVPAGNESEMRLFRGRLALARTTLFTSVALTINVYYDGSDTAAETFYRTVSASIPNPRAEVKPRRRSCSRFSFEVRFAPGALAVRLAGWSAEVGVPGGHQRITGSQ